MEHVITLHDLVRTVTRHWFAALAVFVATVTAFAVVTIMSVRIYESEAKVLVKFGREFVYRPDGERPVVVRGDDEAVINTEIQILRGHSLMQAAIESLGRTNLYPDMEESESSLAVAVQKFKGNLFVQPVLEANVIRVSFRHPNPEMAAKAVNVVIDLFLEKHLMAFSDPKATAFFEEKALKYRAELEDAEDGLRSFLAENQPFLDNGQTLLNQRKDVHAAVADVENEIAGLRRKLSFLTAEEEQVLQGSASPEEESRGTTEAKANLLALQLQEEQLLGKFQETNRQVVNIRKQIALVKSFLDEQAALAGKSEIGQNLEIQIINTRADLRFQEAKAESLRRQLNQLNRDLARLPLLEGEFRELTRKRDSNEKNYETYVKRLEDARISEEMDRQKIANISVIQHGFVPTRPISPRVRLNLAVGILLGAGLGVGSAFLAEGAARRTHPQPQPQRVVEKARGFRS